MNKIINLIIFILIFIQLNSCATRQGTTDPKEAQNPPPPAPSSCTAIQVNINGICYPDTDGDKITDEQETKDKTSPLNKDTDGDTFDDFCEKIKGTIPTDASSKPADCNINGQTAGTAGAAGGSGKAGVNCWDLNGNGTPDIDTEDTNKDKNVNVQDCQMYIKDTCQKDETNCIECKKGTDGKCVTAKNTCEEVNIKKPDNCKEICAKTFTDDKLTICKNNCAKTIKIPASQSDCSLNNKIPPNYKKIKVEVTACVNGYHVLTPSLHSLSWQTINIYDFYNNKGDYASVNKGTAEIDDEGNVDVGFAEHCQESDATIKDFFNKAYVKIEGQEKNWNYPAYNSFDLWQYLKEYEIDTTQAYFIVLASKDKDNGYFVYDLDDYEDEDGHPKNENDMLSLIRTLYEPTSSTNGQVKTMIETMVLDNYAFYSFEPIAQVAFDIYYAPIKEKEAAKQ